MNQKLTSLLNWMKNNKMAGVAIILFVILALVFLFFKPSATVSPTPLPTTPPPLTFIRFTPNPPTFASIRSTEPVTVEFNRPIKESSISVSINPRIEFKTTYQGNTPNKFSIVPLKGWKLDQEYTITIASTISSTSGAQLNEQQAIKIKRVSVESKGIPLPGDH